MPNVNRKHFAFAKAKMLEIIIAFVTISLFKCTMGEWQTTDVNGNEMRLYVAKASYKEAPGLMVFQEAFGINSHIRNICDKFAEDGFYVVAPELYHRTNPGFEGSYTDKAESLALAKAYALPQMEEDITATYKWLTRAINSNNVASIGYCLGGKVAFLANGMAKLLGSVCYYGDIPSLVDEEAENQYGPLLMLWGGKDEKLGRDAAQKAADGLDKNNKVYTNVVFSEAGHGFNCDERKEYHAQSANQASALVKEFMFQSMRRIPIDGSNYPTK